MPCHLSVPDDLPIIESVYEGVLTVQEMNANVDAINALVSLHGRHLLLADCSNFCGAQIALLDLHAFVQELSENPLSARVKEAVIMADTPEGVELASFWEMICRNRGIMVRSFLDRASALEWLLAGVPQ